MVRPVLSYVYRLLRIMVRVRVRVIGHSPVVLVVLFIVYCFICCLVYCFS